MDAVRPIRRLQTALALTAMLLAATPAAVHATTSDAQVRDLAGALSPGQQADLLKQANAVAGAGTPVLVELRTGDEDGDQTVADAESLMTDDDVESAPGARDGLVVLVSLHPGNRHGTAAIFAGQSLLDGRLPQDEVQRVYDDEMAPRLHDGQVAAAVDAGLVAVARYLRDGPPPPTPGQQAAASATRDVLDPAALLLLALVVVTAMRVWRRRTVVVVGTAVQPASPADAPPAIAGALWQGRLTGSLVRASLVDLARRGGFRMEGGRRSQVRIRCVDSTVPRTPWERELWSALLEVADDDGWVSTRRLARTLRRRERVLHPLHDDLVRRGWFEPQMAAIRRPLQLLGTLALAVTGVTALVAVSGAEPWGWLGISAASAAAFVAFAVPAHLPELTPEGTTAAARWERYRENLLSRFDDPSDTIDWDTDLGHAVALRLEREMDGRLVSDSRAGYVPPWAELRDRDFYCMWADFDGAGFGAGEGGGGGGGGGGGAGGGGGGAGGSF